MTDAAKNNENYTHVLLEDLRDQFKTFGEGLDVVYRQIEEVRQDLGDRLNKIEEHLALEFPLLRKEIAEIKTILGTKADVARLEVLEARVDRLERTFTQQQS